MFIKKNYLFSPGPTQTMDDAMLAMAKSLVHHRTPEFSKIFEEAAEGLKFLFQTKEDVLILSSSGTGAMEASISNLFAKGEKVLAVVGGKFGERWRDIAKAYGLEVVCIDVEWGKAVDPGQVEEALRVEPDIKGVLVQATETSTAVRHPIEELAKIVSPKEDTLLIVDGITGVGVFDIPFDTLKLDVLLSGSQKAFMIPPGLAFIALSEKAWARNKRSDLPRYYFNLAKERKALKDRTSAYTPAVSLVIGLRVALEHIRQKGLEALFAHTALLSTATRLAFEGVGLELLAKDAPSPALTGVILPDGVPGEKLVKALRDQAGITFAGGQDKFKGKVVRMAHIGYLSELDTLLAIAALELGLARFGVRVEPGKAVGIAEQAFLEAGFLKEV